MSDLELMDAHSAWWSPLVGVLLIALFVAACWVLVHPHTTWTYLRLVYRRGRTYRAQLRAARHRSPRHLTFRSPVR